MGTQKLLQYAVEFVVFASSSCVFPSAGVSDLGASSPVLTLNTPYAITKQLGEQYVRFWANHYGLDAVILRFHNTYCVGDYPGPYRSVIPRFFETAFAHQPLIITVEGRESRDFNYCDNTVAAALLAAEVRAARGNTFSIGSGEETRIIDLAKKSTDWSATRPASRCVRGGAGIP